MTKLVVSNPVAQVKVRKASLSPRSGTLDNKRIGLYWNGHPGGEVALAHVAELLKERYKTATFELIRSSVPGPKDTVKKAKTYDAVVASTGD